MVKKIVIGTIAGLVIIVVVIWQFFLRRDFVRPDSYNPPPQISGLCQADSDCVLAAKKIEGEPCCWDCGYIAINGGDLAQRDAWEKSNCSAEAQRSCSMMCKAAPSDWYRAVCRAGKCELIDNPDRNSGEGSGNGSCVCPAGYRQEGNVCNPECYYLTPKCLQASITCKPAGGNEENENASSTGAGMANPASVYCVQQGGESRIVEDAGGQKGNQKGICVMKDGTECDEWKFFRTLKCGEFSAGGTETGAKCGRENCHGLDIKCGANVAEVCTMEYQLGDKCLRYVNCGVANGTCQQIADTSFDSCKSCVEKCAADFKNDQAKMFDCEGKCQ